MWPLISDKPLADLKDPLKNDATYRQTKKKIC